jgi:3-hydroxybutyryl-CoA dehydratase
MAFTEHDLYYDDVEVGQEWESGGRTLTETDIVNFAGLSGDFNPIHVDHEFCRGTPFRRPIAHGILGLAFSSGLGLHYPPVRTLAFLSIREWHFKEPIFIGDTVRIKSKVLEKEPRSRGRRGMIAWQRQLINQDGRIVQEGVTLTLVEGRGKMAGKAPPADKAG